MEKDITSTKHQHFGIVIVSMLAFWHKHTAQSTIVHSHLWDTAVKHTATQLLAWLEPRVLHSLLYWLSTLSCWLIKTKVIAAFSQGFLSQLRECERWLLLCVVVISSKTPSSYPRQRIMNEAIWVSFLLEGSSTCCWALNVWPSLLAQHCCQTRASILDDCGKTLEIVTLYNIHPWHQCYD